MFWHFDTVNEMFKNNFLTEQLWVTASGNN